MNVNESVGVENGSMRKPGAELENTHYTPMNICMHRKAGVNTTMMKEPLKKKEK